MKGYLSTPSSRSVDRIIKKCGEDAIRLPNNSAAEQPGTPPKESPLGDNSQGVALFSKKSMKQPLDTPVPARPITPRKWPSDAKGQEPKGPPTPALAES